MAEKIAKLGLKRRDDMMYYIKGGDVWGVPRKLPGKPAGKAQKVASTGVKMDLASYLYFLDADGDIARAKRAGVAVKEEEEGADEEDGGEKAEAKAKAKAKAKARKKNHRDGAAEAAEWCAARAMTTDDRTRWHVNIALDVVDKPAAQEYAKATATRFHLDLYRDEWGFVFVHGGKTSHVRRTAAEQIASGADEHALVAKMPALADVGAFVRGLEQKHRVTFKRQHALVRTNLPGGATAIRAWLSTL